MDDRDEPQPPGPPGEEPGSPGPARPRTTNLAAVAGAVVLIGLVALALYRRSHAPAPAPPPASPEATPPAGTPITAVVPFHLTPEASIVAERYRCVCGCNDLLNVCTCNKTPGSNDMKRFLQGLVAERKSVDEIDGAMVGKYGDDVLLSKTPAPRPTAAPKATPARRPAPAARRKP